jgi:hypothetical protein
MAAKPPLRDPAKAVAAPTRFVARKPEVRVALAQSMPLYRTQAGRDLATAYLELLAATGGRVPEKRELDVTRFARAIPHIVLAAIVKPDKCLYRVVGEEVKARIGMNPVGRNYYDFVPPERRARAARAMHMVLDTPCGFRVELEQIYSNRLSRLVEGVALPLRSREPGVDGFIVFGDCHIGPSQRVAEPGVVLLGATIVRRDLIDIGFGVDESFEDLVPAPPE